MMVTLCSITAVTIHKGTLAGPGAGPGAGIQATGAEAVTEQLSCVATAVNVLLMVK